MFNRKFAAMTSMLAAAVVMFGAATPAEAQTFYSQANAYTSAVPGAYNTYSGQQNSLTASALADPAGSTYNNGYGMVFSDAYTLAETQNGNVHITAFAQATRYTATAFNYAPQANGNVKVTDVLTVVSSTLPKGTPVQLRFRSNAQIAFNGGGLWQGSGTVYMSAGGKYANKRIDGSYTGSGNNTGETEFVIDTRVGNRVQVSMQVTAMALAYHFRPGPLYSGVMTTEVTAGVTVEPLTAGAAVVSDSGRIY
jgi:hypothetical protein